MGICPSWLQEPASKKCLAGHMASKAEGWDAARLRGDSTAGLTAGGLRAVLWLLERAHEVLRGAPHRARSCVSRGLYVCDLAA